jgi:hypothetical protein
LPEHWRHRATGPDGGRVRIGRGGGPGVAYRAGCPASAGQAAHGVQVGLAVGRQAAALAGPDHLAQALHHLVVGLVQRAAAPRGQQLHRLADAGGLVDGHLLVDRQVHAQVQEGVGAAFLDRVDGGQRGGLVGQLGVVFGVLKPIQSRGQGLHRLQRQRRRAGGA